MGSNSLGIFIKTDTKIYTHKKIAFDLFGATEEYDYSMNTLKYYDYITITFHDSLIEIHNSEFVEKFIENKKETEVHTLNNYFNNPEFILSYISFDTTNSFGFKYIEKGRTIRLKLEDDSYITEFGQPIEEELKYLNGDYKYIEEEDEKLLVVSPVNDNNEFAYFHVTSSLVSDVLISRLGFGIHDSPKNTVTKYFKIKKVEEQITKVAVRKEKPKKGFYDKLFGN